MTVESRHEQLPNKPLVEAIFELRWNVEDQPPAQPGGTIHRLILGRFYDRIAKEFPVFEALPAAQVPEELVLHTVQHRFRKNRGDWPVVQLGPGVLTVNSTHDYSWTSFRPIVLETVKHLLQSLKDTPGVRFDSIILRLLDAVEFDYAKEDALHFFKEKFGLAINLPEDLFSEESGLSNHVLGGSYDFLFASKKPTGRLNAKFGLGQRGSKRGILWETTLISRKEHVPNDVDSIESWLDDAHRTTGDWFFTLIDGDLIKQFR